MFCSYISSNSLWISHNERYWTMHFFEKFYKIFDEFCIKFIDVYNYRRTTNLFFIRRLEWNNVFDRNFEKVNLTIWREKTSIALHVKSRLFLILLRFRNYVAMYANCACNQQQFSISLFDLFTMSSQSLKFSTTLQQFRIMFFWNFS